MAWVAGRYAARSVRRNVRRSVLAIAGIAGNAAATAPAFIAHRRDTRLVMVLLLLQDTSTMRAFRSGAMPYLLRYL